MNKILKRIIPLLLAICLLAYALKDISFKSILSQFQKADYEYILFTFILATLTFYLRGWRWQQPLNALGYHPTVLRSTIALLAGTIAGMIVPGTGEALPLKTGSTRIFSPSTCI